MLKHSNRHIRGRWFAPLLAVCLLAACNRYENPYNFVWDRTYGQGSILSVAITPDTGIVVCGYQGNSPYLLKLSSAKEIDSEVVLDIEGRFSSVIADTSGFIAAGSSDAKLLLSKFNKQGTTIWDTLISTSYPIDVANICVTGNNKYVAVASASADSLKSVVCGLLFVDFDGDGNISRTKEVVETSSIFSEGLAVDDGGNLYLTITRRYGNKNSTAGAAKFNPDWYKIWEKDLYNNPNYGAETVDIICNENTLYLSGRTETLSEETVINNSFMVALNSYDGVDLWKSYREKSNIGVGIILADDDRIMMLNKNCYVVSVADAFDGNNAGVMRMFDACDSYNTSEIATSICLNVNGNILVGGSKGGTIFLAEKSTDQIDEF